MKRRDCVIVAGGDFSEGDAEWLRQRMKGVDRIAGTAAEDGHDVPYLIAADRGIEALLARGWMPDLWIGDFDSVEASVSARMGAAAGQKEAKEAGDANGEAAARTGCECIRLNPVKDDTDTEAALREALSRTDGTITILGGTGTRLDHVLANIHILKIALDAGRDAFLQNAHNRIRLTDHACRLRRDTQYGSYLSLFPLYGAIRGLTLTGVRYPLTDAVLPPGTSLGTSNEITAEEAVIAFDEGILVLIEGQD